MADTANYVTRRRMSKSLIPTEIITDEILPKLSAKSLLRFKCVSKSFNALISSTEFIQLHLGETRSSDANRLLILAGADSLNLYTINVDSPDSVTTISLPCNAPHGWRPRKVSIVGSFDGLICVGLSIHRSTYDDHFKHVLINPSTGVLQEIPYKHPPMVFAQSDIKLSFGFGFDDLNRDYKLVRVHQTYSLNYDINTEVMVYSLNQNTWKLVENVKQPIDSLLEGQNGVLLKNHLLHWMFSSSDHYRIGCFDTRSDKWASDIPLTKELFEHDEFRVQSLGVINGCLCLSTATFVWMLKDYEAKDSWVKLFHIPQSTRPFFCFHRESKYEVLVAEKKSNDINELVAEKKSNDINELCWYDIGPITYGRKRKIKGIPASDGGCFYKGSLVQIPGGRQLDVSTFQRR